MYASIKAKSLPGEAGPSSYAYTLEDSLALENKQNQTTDFGLLIYVLFCFEKKMLFCPPTKREVEHKVDFKN